MVGSRKRGVGPNLRQPRPIDAHHDTATGSDPGSASDSLPAGHDAEQHALDPRGASRAEADANRCCVGGTIPLDVGGEEAGVAAEHVVGVQLVGLSAESTDRLQAIEEMRLGLGGHALHLAVGRTLVD